MATLNQAMHELNYMGKPVYLPTKYLSNPEASKAYVPRLKSGKLLSPEQTRKLEAQQPSRISPGIFITPPGAQLARLFEDTLGTNFTRVDLDYLQQNMPRLLIEDLEIASDVEIQAGTSKKSTQIVNSTTQITLEHDMINVRITSTAYKHATKELSTIYTTLGSPLTSAIAIAIAKAAGKPTVIENYRVSDDGETFEVEYRTLEEEQPQP
jgi:hypothetical protein